MRLDPLIGTEIGGYRIEEFIGRGGMGVVYRAEHVLLGRKDAVKVLSPELAEDEGFRERFLKESRLAASIEHPNIIPIHHAGEVDGLLYIAMRYVEGTDLRTELKDHGRLSLDRTVEIVEQVSAALDAAHVRGLVHRDVKPANILISPQERVYLTDFGIAKHTATRGGLTRTGSFVGTLHYAAPEQIEGKDLDGRADLYALGCVIYECLTGDVPYNKETEVQLIYAHLLDTPPVLTDAMPELPGHLNDVIATALAKSRDDRYPTCGQLAAAMREGLEEARAAPPTEARPARAAETEAAPATPPPLVVPPTPAEPRQPPVEKAPEPPVESPVPPPIERRPEPAVEPPAPPPVERRPEPPVEPPAPPPVERPRQPVPAPVPEPARPREARRSRTPIVVAGGLIVVAVAVGLFLTSRGGSGSFPTKAEQALLDYIPRGLRSSCTREDNASEQAVASVSCVTGQITATYSRFASKKAMNNVYARELAASGIKRNSGACQEPPFLGERSYGIGSESAGSIFCLTEEVGPGIAWTANRARTYARASQLSGDPTSLAGWWRRSAGPLSKPGARSIPVQTAALAKGQVIFSDSFANRSNGWPSSNTSADQLGYGKGAYRITVKSKQVFVQASTAELERPLVFGSVDLDLRAEQLTRRRQYSLGFVCRLVSGPKGAEFYALMVRSDGRAQVRKRLGGRWVRLARERLGRIPRGAVRLYGSCTGGRSSPVQLTLALNGRRVVAARDRKPLAQRGAAGMAVSSGNEGNVVVAFSEFSVRKA